MREFYENIVKRFLDNSKIKIFNFGISHKTEERNVSISADGTSVYFTGGIIEKIKLIALDDFLRIYKINRVDLIKINIEGGEYSLLAHMINTGIVEIFDNIQVQYHKVFDEGRIMRNSITKGLKETHKRQWCFPYKWESWKR